MAKYSIGLKSLKMGEVAADGGMGTALTDFGSTFKGTATLTQEDAQKTEFYVDKMVDPVIVAAQPGKKTLAFTVVNLDPDNLVRLLGGTYDAQNVAWNAPRDIVTMERSIELITDFDSKVEIPRADVSAKINWNFTRTEVAKIEVSCTILTPQKADVAPIIVSEVPVVVPVTPTP